MEHKKKYTREEAEKIKQEFKQYLDQIIFRKSDIAEMVGVGRTYMSSQLNSNRRNMSAKMLKRMQTIMGACPLCGNEKKNVRGE
jgi:predicted XRE-type DNA-binding protein